MTTQRRVKWLYFGILALMAALWTFASIFGGEIKAQIDNGLTIVSAGLVLAMGIALFVQWRAARRHGKR